MRYTPSSVSLSSFSAGSESHPCTVWTITKPERASIIRVISLRDMSEVGSENMPQAIREHLAAS